MKAIDFTKYPKIYPYVEKHIGKSYFKPFEYSDLDEETYISIISDFVDEYEKHKEILIKNTLLVYDLTNEETGYRCLSQDWSRQKDVFPKREKRFTKELVTQWWDEKVSACISHIYQSLQYQGKDIKGGVSGCLFTVTYNIHFIDHEKKGYKYNVVVDFGFRLCLEHSIHNEYDLQENN